MFTGLNTSSASASGSPGASSVLSPQRQRSSIPMAPPDKLPLHQQPGQEAWEYPSEQMFFNAMRRKVGWAHAAETCNVAASSPPPPPPPPPRTLAAWLGGPAGVNDARWGRALIENTAGGAGLGSCCAAAPAPPPHHHHTNTHDTHTTCDIRHDISHSRPVLLCRRMRHAHAGGLVSQGSLQMCVRHWPPWFGVCARRVGTRRRVTCGPWSGSTTR